MLIQIKNFILLYILKKKTVVLTLLYLYYFYVLNKKNNDFNNTVARYLNIGYAMTKRSYKFFLWNLISKTIEIFNIDRNKFASTQNKNFPIKKNSQHLYDPSHRTN